MKTFFEDVATTEECITLGPYSTFALRTDPKHLFFSMARYKFCSKMLARCKTILEIGCGDGFGVPLFMENKSTMYCLDTNKKIIEYNQKNNRYPSDIEYGCFNILTSPTPILFDAAISLDVIEHIPHDLEDVFLQNIAQSCKPNAACIIGTPNITAAQHASKGSRDNHINLQSHTTLIQSLDKHFHNVFLFSMNDEIIHTGFYPMAHYLMALAVGPKKH